ncbi:integrase catalytic domain-containing protein, partial [Undibacterium sp. JH2W]|uniref:integrase catalytic domain-containing protein n=1 Tax=Undibacterium sp. JH2W TaxID=3413037 RepID=UPI003BF0BF95
MQNRMTTMWQSRLNPAKIARSQFGKKYDGSGVRNMECIKDAMQLFGQPKIIRTDNASVFRSKKFRRALKELGIHQE